MFIHFDTTHERDRHRDIDRHRMTAWAALMHSIARQNESGTPPTIDGPIWPWALAAAKRPAGLPLS